MEIDKVSIDLRGSTKQERLLIAKCLKDNKQSLYNEIRFTTIDIFHFSGYEKGSPRCCGSNGTVKAILTPKEFLNTFNKRKINLKAIYG